MDRNNDIISKFHKLVPDEYKVLSYLFKYNKLASETDLDDLGKSVFEVYEGILELSEKEHILQAPKYKEFVQVSDERLKNLVGQNLQQVILELTEKCNLRCKYCVYHGMGYGEKGNRLYLFP